MIKFTLAAGNMATYVHASDIVQIQELEAGGPTGAASVVVIKQVGTIVRLIVKETPEQVLYKIKEFQNE